MKQPNAALRLAAVCFSMLLVSGFVYLRAGGSAKVMPGSKSAGVVAPAERPPGTPPAFVTSTGDVVLIRPTTQPGESLTLTPQKRAIFYGSKSAPVALPGDTVTLGSSATTQQYLLVGKGSEAAKPPAPTSRSAFALPATTLPTNTLDPLLPPGLKSTDTVAQGTGTISVTTRPSAKP